MKKKLLVIVILLCAQLFYSQEGKKDLQTIKNNTLSKTELNNFIQSQIDSLKVAGLSVAIIRNKRIVYNEAFGFKNLATKEYCTTETIFEACSLSKPVFAYFLMLQETKGLIDLDKPLYKYVSNPDLEDDERYNRITARMVLCHVSGLPNWRENTDGQLELIFDPRTEFGYSGEGYQYLKEVLKHLLKVDDNGLNRIFQEEVVKPLAIDFMQYTWEDNFSSRKAFGHRNGVPTQNGPKFLKEGFNEFGSAYSLLTTSRDYANFLIHLMNPKGNNREVIQPLLTIQEELPTEEGELHRSLAFPVKQVENELRYYHSGNNGDFRAYCQFNKEKGSGLVMFSNSDNFFSSGCAKRIVEILEDV